MISRKRPSEAWCLQVRLFRIEAFAHVGLRRLLVYVVAKASLMTIVFCKGMHRCFRADTFVLPPRVSMFKMAGMLTKHIK